MASKLKESPRIRGERLGFKLNETEYWPDMSSVTLEPVDKDDSATFGSINVGGTPMQLKVAGIQSTAKASLWRFLFDHVGETVPFMIAVHGNEKPTDDQPHVTGKCTIEKPPALSTEVNETATFELELPVEDWTLTGGTAAPLG